MATTNRNIASHILCRSIEARTNEEKKSNRHAAREREGERVNLFARLSRNCAYSIVLLNDIHIILPCNHNIAITENGNKKPI